MTTQRMQQKAELKTENSVLLDKIALYNFTIESVDDMESLQELRYHHNKRKATALCCT